MFDRWLNKVFYFSDSLIKQKTTITLSVVSVFFSFLLGCSAGNPIIKSLGFLGVKVSDFSISIPAGDTIQVANLTQSFQLNGVCPATIQGLEFSLDGKTYYRLESANVNINNNCESSKTFSAQISDLNGLAQKLATLSGGTSTGTTQSSSMSNVVVYVRGYSSNGYSEPSILTFTTTPGTSPLVSGDGLSIYSNVTSDVGLTKGSLNPEFGAKVVWSNSASSSSSVFIEVSSDGGGSTSTWIPILKADNSGQAIVPAALAKIYLSNGAKVRISELSGGNKVIALSNQLTVISNSPAAPSSMALVTPSSSPNKVASISFDVHSAATSAQSIGIYKDAQCSQFVKSKAASGSGVDSIAINGLSVDGAYDYFAKVIDGAGNQSSCLATSVHYVFDATAPAITGLSDDSNPAVSKTWNWGCNEANGPCVYRWVISTSATVPSGFSSQSYGSDVTATQSGGTNKYYLYVQAKDAAGNESAVKSVSAEINSSAPAITFSSPSVSLVKQSSTFYFDLTYTNIKAGSITLAVGDVVLTYTSTATGCTVNSVTEVSSSVRRVTLGGCAGNGTVKMKVAAGTAKSPANVAAAASGDSSAVNIDNANPVLTLGVPSKTDANSSVTINIGVTANESVVMNLTNSYVQLNGTTDGCAVNVLNPTLATPTIQVSGCTGNGSLTVGILAGAATDTVGNASDASVVSSAITIDNTAPTIALGTPNKSAGNSSTHFLIGVTYSGANQFNLTSGMVSFSGTATTGCSVSIIGGATSTPTVDISGCTGNGSMQFSIAAGAGKDAATNQTAASATSSVMTIDNTPPTISIGMPSVTDVKSSTSISYSVTYGSASTYNLTNANVSFSGTATAGCSANVTDGTTSTPTVVVSGCSGNGTMQFTIAAGVATDAAGNGSPVSASSVAVNVDNNAPMIAISAPSVSIGNSSTNFDYTITYSGSTSQNLTSAQITIGGTATTGCVASVSNGSSVTPTVRISGCSGNGTANFSIQAGTASDAAGNSAGVSSTSSNVTVDNTIPVITGLSSDSTPVTQVNWNWSCTDTNSPCTYRYVVSATDLTTPFSGSDLYGSSTSASQIGGSGTYYLYVQAKDSAGNVSGVTSVTANLNSNKPGIIIALPSQGIAKSSDSFYYDVYYSNYGSISLNSAKVSFTYTGSAASCNSAVSTVSADIRRVTISGCTGDGTVAISLAANTAMSPANVQADPAGPSSTVTIDNTKPILSLGAPSSTLIRNGTSTNYVVTYSGDSIVNLSAGQITFSGAGATGCQAVVTNGTTLTPTITVSNCTGNGTMQFSIAASSAADSAGNGTLSSSNSTAVTVDNNAPTVAIAAPSSASINSTGSTSFAVTYTGADTVNLTSGQITAVYTGSASCTIGVTGGTTATPTVGLSNCTGDGTVNFSIAAATASDNAGNTSAVSAASSSVTIDNTVPTLAVGAPNYTFANSSRSVSFGVSYSGGGTYNLTSGKINLSGASTGCTPSVTGGTTSTPTVSIVGCTGNGAVTFSVAASATTDAAGNPSNLTASGQSFTADNVAPSVTVGSPSVSYANNTVNIDYLITFSGQSSISMLASDIVFTGASTGCSKSIIGTTTDTRTVRVSGCTGNGSLQINVAAGKASDDAGNLSPASGLSNAVSIDNTDPTLSIAAPSPADGHAGTTFGFNLTYAGADTVALTAGMLSLSYTGSVSCSAPVLTGGATTSPTVSVSGCSGEGTMKLNVAGGAASDLTGNLDAGGSSASVNVDNTAPTVAIGSPSVSMGNSVTSFVYTVTYTGASSISLSNSQVNSNLIGASTGCSAAVTGSGSSTRTVTITGCSSDGLLSFSVPAGTAVDAAGNNATASSASTTVTIDNTAPVLSWGTISPSDGKSTTTYTFNLNYTGASTVNLLATQVTVAYTGTASCGSKTISGGGTSTPVVNLSSCSGDGTATISITAGSAWDAVNNQVGAFGPSTAITIDNTGPLVSIGAPSVSSAKASTTITYAVAVGANSSFALVNSDVVFSGTASAGCAATVSGVTATGATVTVSGCTGDGAMNINIKAGVASDAVGNTSAASSLSSQVTVDNTGPGVTVGTAAPTSGGPSTHFIFPVSYSGSPTSQDIVGASNINLQGQTSGCSVTVNNPTSATPTIDVTGCTANGTLQVQVKANVASDALGNSSSISAWSPAVTLSNPVTIGYDTGTKLEYKSDLGVSYLNATYGIYAADLSSIVTVTDFKGGGPVDHYEVALGTQVSSTNINNWTGVGLNLTPTITMSSLQPGHTYFASVRAVDGSGTATTALSDSGLFAKYIAGSGFTESGTVAFGTVVAASSDGLRLMVGDPANETVYVYARSSGVRQSWSKIATWTAAGDGIQSANSDSQFGAALAVQVVGSGKYFYVVGAPAAKSSNGSGTYGGRIVSHFESGAVVGAALQVLRSKDVLNQSSENVTGDGFGSSLAIWTSGGNSYLFIGSPGQDCYDSAGGLLCPNTKTDSGAVYVMNLSCPSLTCSATSLTANSKRIEGGGAANNRYGSVIQSTESGYLVSSSSKIYWQNSITQSNTSVASGLTINSSNILSVTEAGTTTGTPLIGYLDAVGTVNLGKWNGTSFDWKVGATTGWKSLSLYSDTTSGNNDQQGVSIALGDSSTSYRAVTGFLDWSLSAGYYLTQDLGAIATGVGATDQFGASVAARGSYIFIAAPAGNKVYLFH